MIPTPPSGFAAPSLCFEAHLPQGCAAFFLQSMSWEQGRGQQPLWAFIYESATAKICPWSKILNARSSKTV